MEKLIEENQEKTFWSGNEGAGLVHRSPKVESVNQKRLLLTIDFSDK